MKIKPYVEKLHSSTEFKEFQEKYPQSFMTAGFFIVDLESGKNIHQIDYYLPSEKKMAAFTLDGNVTMQLMKMMGKKLPKTLDLNVNTDLDNLQGIIHDEMRNRNMSENIKKIIAVVQNLDGKKTWILNCILSGMEVLKVHIDDDSQTVLKMEKLSMLDLIKTVPNPNTPTNAPVDLKGELKNLQKMEKEIKKEETEVKKEIEKEEK